MPKMFCLVDVSLFGCGSDHMLFLTVTEYRIPKTGHPLNVAW